jgi:hypothetical protein
LEIVQVKATGQDSSGEDSSLGLRVLTSLLDSLQLDPHAVIGFSYLSFTPAAGAQAITIGDLGTVDIDYKMPVRIDRSSFMRINGSDYRIWFADSWEEYTEKRDKSLQGFACAAYYMRQNTGIGILHLYPAANGAEYFLYVDEDIIYQFDTITLSTSLILPRGYRWMLEYMLADKLALDYSINPNLAAAIKAEAAIAMRRLKRTNKRVPQLTMPRGTEYDAQSDSYVT